MSALFEILRYSTGSVLLGILFGLACLALFFFLIKGWYKNATFTPVSYIVGAVLGILLIFQSILICGSVSIYRSISRYEMIAQEMVDKYLAYNPDRVFTNSETNALTQDIISNNPLLSYYVGGSEIVGYNVSQYPKALADACRTYFRWYIFRRVMWSLGFVIVAAVIVIKTMEHSQQSHRPSRTRPASRTRMGARPASRTRRR